MRLRASKKMNHLAPKAMSTTTTTTVMMMIMMMTMMGPTTISKRLSIKVRGGRFQAVMLSCQILMTSRT